MQVADGVPRPSVARFDLSHIAVKRSASRARRIKGASDNG